MGVFEWIWALKCKRTTQNGAGAKFCHYWNHLFLPTTAYIKLKNLHKVWEIVSIYGLLVMYMIGKSIIMSAILYRKYYIRVITAKSMALPLLKSYSKSKNLQNYRVIVSIYNFFHHFYFFIFYIAKIHFSLQ